MHFDPSLSVEPRCVVCRKQLTLAEAQPVQLAGPVSILACAAHRELAEQGVAGARLVGAHVWATQNHRVFGLVARIQRLLGR